jgi:dTDP-4-dehydrorhamnose 3,5-epimerase
MKFTPLKIAGACLVDLETRGDDRGFFARVFCHKEFADQGLATQFIEINTSFTKYKHTLRGMHYQLGQSSEVKVVKCISGRLLDVIVDLRPDSSTFKQWASAELSAENRSMMYIPAGCAHGFMSLSDDVEMTYFVTKSYDPVRERNLRWNDPEFGIVWPHPPLMISDKDAGARDFDPAWHLADI